MADGTRWGIAILCTMMVVTIVDGASSYPYCTPGDDSGCWPSAEALSGLQASLSPNARILTMSDGYQFLSLSVQRCTNLNSIVGIIVMVADTSDVVAAVQFAVKYNIKISVKNTGHSYNGASTFDGSLQINLSQMDDIIVDAENMLMTLGAGCQFQDAYAVAANYSAVIVGGHDPTVGAIGLTLGGGHGALARMYGLAADNVVSFTIVAVTGEVVIANATTNKDLFWALRGAGGGTFGVVVDMTIKMHPAPSAIWALYIQCVLQATDQDGNIVEVGKSMINHFFNNATWWAEMPENFSGWGIVNDDNIMDDTEGSFLANFNYFGDHEDAKKYLQQFTNYYTEWVEEGWIQSAPLIPFKSMSSFAEANADQSNWYRQFICNVLPSAAETSERFGAEIVNAVLNGREYGDLNPSWFINMVFGGQISKVPSNTTAVSKGFREALYEIGVGNSWMNPEDDLENMQVNDIFASRLRSAFSSTYRWEYTSRMGYNNITDWKERFFGDHYDNLLQIKNKWDPCNFMWIYQGVGFDQPYNHCNNQH